MKSIFVIIYFYDFNLLQVTSDHVKKSKQKNNSPQQQQQ